MTESHLVDFLCAAPLLVFAAVASLLTIPSVRRQVGKSPNPISATETRVVWAIMIAAGACGLRLLTHAIGFA